MTRDSRTNEKFVSHAKPQRIEAKVLHVFSRHISLKFEFEFGIIEDMNVRWAHTIIRS